jgi:putative ABC transport system permease protein
MGARVWMRWAWTDVRLRWRQVAAISAVLALGIGLYTALASVGAWRVASNDASFALLRAHDVRASLSEAGVVPAGTLLAAARGLDDAAVAGARERLVVPTQLDASTPGRTVLTPGRIVGSGPATGPVDRLYVERGRGMRAAEAGRPVAVLEAAFAEHYDLPARGRLRLGGGRHLDYVGHGRSPEYFVVTAPGTAFGAEAALGVVFTSLATAQRLAGTPGAVNELVLRVAPGADPGVVADHLRQELAARLPGAGVEITLGDEEEAHRLLYRDAENDQRVYDVIAALLLAGAGLAVFTLAGRVVESQRREIGIGMALGVPPRALAVRPLLMGAQIAALAAALGVGVGLATAAALRPVLRDLLPLPVHLTPFEPMTFARGAAVAVAIPLIATLYPVWRGVRVPPVEAIRVGARSARGGGLAPLARRVPLPGGSLARMGPRNVLRAPRRTALTALGLAAVVCCLVAIAGMIDSVDETIARSEADTARGGPARMVVDLDGFHAVGSPVLTRLSSAAAVGAAEPGVALSGTLHRGETVVDVSVALVDPAGRTWRPAAADGDVPRGPGEVLISRAAADDLGVGVGDRIALRHPRRLGPRSFSLVEERVRVGGIHPNPFRFLAYMHPSAARSFGVAGLANTVSVTPATGYGQDEVARAAFAIPGVASAQAAAAATDTVRDRMDDFSGIIQVAKGAALLLVVLIAFNATSIGADERAREHATMLAFGVPVRSVVGTAIAESALIGLLGTIVGVGLGLAVLDWIVGTLFAETVPSLGAVPALSAGSLATAAVVGVLGVALAPLLAARGIGRADVPSALRVIE